MKRLGLTLVAAVCLTATTFAAGNQPTTAKWEGNINITKLSKYLNLDSNQHEEVANICEYFTEQMERATNSKKNQEKLLRNAVYGNLKLMKKTLKGIVTNPIILGIAVGMLWSVLHIPQPTILQKSVSYLGNMATPLALIALGASFRLENAKGKLGLTLGISAAKLFLFCALFLPAAIWLGFRTEKLIAILVMLGSATTCSCFVMAKNMKHDGTITACAVMMTTLLSAFSLTMWLFVMKSLGYI